MRKVFLKNGHVIEVHQNVADILFERILAAEKHDLQTFTIDGVNQQCFRLSEIAAID